MHTIIALSLLLLGTPTQAELDAPDGAVTIDGSLVLAPVLSHATDIPEFHVSFKSSAPAPFTAIYLQPRSGIILDGQEYSSHSFRWAGIVPTISPGETCDFRIGLGGYLPGAERRQYSKKLQRWLWELPLRSGEHRISFFLRRSSGPKSQRITSNEVSSSGTALLPCSRSDFFQGESDLAGHGGRHPSQKPCQAGLAEVTCRRKQPTNMPTEHLQKTRPSLRSPLAAGLVFGGIQAVWPPIGELEISVCIHLGLFVAFSVVVLPACRGFGRLIAGAAYVGILALAVALPFKFLDEQVNLGTAQLELAALPIRMQAAGYPVRVRDALAPNVDLHLPSSTPTLRELDHALFLQTGYRLRSFISCGNSVSLSFLWGPRVSYPHLWLIATDRALARLGVGSRGLTGRRPEGAC